MKNLIAAMTLAAALGGTASGSLIYSDFGAGNSYDATHNWQIGGSVESVLGTSFTAAATSIVTQIDIAVFNVSGQPNGGFTVTLAQDSSGEPGSTIESFTGISFPNPGGLLTISSVLHPLLTSGTTYWLYLGDTLAPDSTGGWYWNNTGVNGIKFEAATHPTTWFTNSFQASPAFDVVGTPEPSAEVLLLTGLLGVVLWGSHSWRRAGTIAGFSVVRK